ncbi:hypothetical protein R5R35_010465 [Gryllus longicercus]|uniref:Accessory gland protein n=1 Tax=Gryllus longicercus TaxID=2509291 RepID=A0AAN9V8L5_9ORTH
MACTRFLCIFAAVAAAAICFAAVDGKAHGKRQVDVYTRLWTNDDIGAYTNDSSEGTLADDYAAMAYAYTNVTEALGNGTRQHMKNFNDAWRAYLRNASALPNILNNEYKIAVNISANYTDIWNNQTAKYLQRGSDALKKIFGGLFG